MLNPNRNHYSVAPIGPNIIIGRKMALQGGLSRESVINLIAWLAIASKATAEEITAEMRLAHEPDAKALAVPGKAVVAVNATSVNGRVIAEQPKTVGVKAADQASIMGKASAFIGDIDPEEASAIAMAINGVSEGG